MKTEMIQEIPTVPRNCLTCGTRFDAAEVNLLGLQIRQQHCEDCCQGAVEAAKEKPLNPSSERNLIVPDCYQGFDMDQLPCDESRQASRKCFEWKESKRGVGLAGESGLGKSFIIHELIRRWSEHKKVFVTTATEFAWCVGSPDQSERRKYLQNCISAPFLLVDDIGKEKMTERVESDFYHVLEQRRRYLRPLFATVNSSGAHLRDGMTIDRGKPILNRMAEMCEFHVIKKSK